MDFLTDLAAEAERLWQEAQDEAERERIRKEIREHELAKAKAQGYIGLAKSNKDSFVAQMNGIAEKYLCDITIAKGSVYEEYERVYEEFHRTYMRILNYYEGVISDAEGKIPIIDERISKLYEELNSI